MEIKGVIKKAGNSEITIRTKDKVIIQDLQKHSIGGMIYAALEVYEKDTVTDLQRKHFYALCGDYEDYTGVPLEFVESFFKVKFMESELLEELPSLKRNAMKKSRASKLLEFVITYMIQNGIPFRKQQFYLTTDTNKMLYALVMKKICWVCGKPNSDIHHATDLVGMGGNRKTHDHLQSTFMCLCREHHNEIHQTGLTEFCKLHHVKPIKLNQKQLTELRVI